MELLPLPAIGWIAVIVSGGAIGVGAWLIAGMHLQGGEMRQYLAARALDDTLLFGIWLLGFGGGIGLLLEKPWSRYAMEIFCWALILLVSMSSYVRLRAAQPPRMQVFMGHLLLIMPVYAYCAATLLTLRSRSALQVLSGQGV